MDYMVSYYVDDVEHQKTFTDYKTAHKFALAHWLSLDKVTRDYYIGNGWNTCIVINNGPWDEDEIITFE